MILDIILAVRAQQTEGAAAECERAAAVARLTCERRKVAQQSALAASGRAFQQNGSALRVCGGACIRQLQRRTERAEGTHPAEGERKRLQVRANAGRDNHGRRHGWRRVGGARAAADVDAEGAHVAGRRWIIICLLRRCAEHRPVFRRSSLVLCAVCEHGLEGGEGWEESQSVCGHPLWPASDGKPSASHLRAAHCCRRLAATESNGGASCCLTKRRQREPSTERKQ